MGIKLHRITLNNILWDELNISVREYFNTRYANTKISDKAKKDLIKVGVSNAIVYWNQQATKEAKTIGRNPKKEIAEKRLSIIQKTLFNYQINRNKSFENKLVNVLVENQMKDKVKLFGRTEHMTSVIFDGEASCVGRIVQVEINSSNQNSLFGKLKENYKKKVA